MAYQGLAQVEFGHIAAEEEAAALQKYFIETEEYSEILDKGKLLVIGRKGSGKSAIYVAIRDMKLIFQQDVSQEKVEEINRFSELHKLVETHFNEEELKTLSFRLGIDYDALPAQGKANKVRELVLYMNRRDRLPELIESCYESRPNVYWGQLRQQETPEYNLPKIRQIIVDNFNLAELRSLCFDLRLDYENLPGGTIDYKAMELVNVCKRNALLPELVDIIQAKRPKIVSEQYLVKRAQTDVPQTEAIKTNNLMVPRQEAVIEALTLHDYPWEIHKRIRDAGIPSEQSYVNSWKYVIWILLAKKFLNYDEPTRFQWVDTMLWKRLFNPNIRFLYRFLKQNYGSIAPSFGEIFSNRARQIRSLKVKDFEVEAGEREDKSQQLSQTINIINRALESRILTVLPDDKEYYLLFDQLDLGWDQTDETKQLLIGLILAARDVIGEANRVDKKVKIVVFLRSDIFESLQFEDKNKVKQSDTVKLNWDEQRLKDLISKRVKASSDGSWEDVFSGQRINGGSQLSFVVKHTMLRPRDMIQFCSCARKAALKASKLKIDNDSLLEGCKAYSDYMRQEIQDECKASFPKINKLLAVLKEIGSQKFSQEQFVKQCEIRKIENAETILQILIDLSVLGTCQHSLNNFRYQVEFWETLEPTKELVVHPSLTSILGIAD